VFVLQGIKGFVIPTKSFVKIGITKIFCYDNKMFSPINKTFGCCSKIFGCRNKEVFVVPNFVAITKPFFSVWDGTFTTFICILIILRVELPPVWLKTKLMLVQFGMLFITFCSYFIVRNGRQYYLFHTQVSLHTRVFNGHLYGSGMFRVLEGTLFFQRKDSKLEKIAQSNSYLVMSRSLPMFYRASFCTVNSLCTYF